VPVQRENRWCCGSKEAEVPAFGGVAGSRNSSVEKAGPEGRVHRIYSSASRSSKWHPEVSRTPSGAIVRVCSCCLRGRPAQGTFGVPVGQQEARRAVIEDRRWSTKIVLWHVEQLPTAKGPVPRLSASGYWSSASPSDGHPEFPQVIRHGSQACVIVVLMWQEAQDGTLPPLATRGVRNSTAGNPNAAWSKLCRRPT